MSEHSNGKVNILIVDDKPEKVLALEAVLEELGENIIRAYSGREALRSLMAHDCAVILLDVNMPGMDGFDTAALIRQRQSTRHIPIIFVTAIHDETHVGRGYSLGAVDYIMAPVVAEVLKTKVSVFVDLYKKSEQVRRQADWLRIRATQLHKLTSASLLINSALSMDKLLQVVTDTAREITDAHQAFTLTLLDGNWARAQVIASLSDKYALHRDQQFRAYDGGIQAMACQANRVVRLTEKELEEHPVWRTQEKEKRRSIALRGWLAVPLRGRDNHNFGLLEVSEKADGEFTGDDEANLLQLAQMTSIAIENTLYAEERQVNRLKDEFLATLSHELRTPLNAILGWTQLLRREGLSPDAEHGFSVIERNAKVQTKLIEDMLDVSRITTGKLRIQTKPLALALVVEAAIDAVRPGAQDKQIELKYTPAATPVHVLGDADRLQQVVWNLLTNAVKFTPAGGRVQVALEHLGAQAIIQVTDNGQGINEKFLPHVFDRFRQADATSTRSQSGLGIGLTIVRHIVELHNGSVHAQSPGDGRGSTFTVTLPVMTAVKQADETRQTNASPVSAHASRGVLAGVSVLLVDDEADSREVVATVLARAGAVVCAVPSVDQAVARFQDHPPDILVTDLAMPHRDGYELIRLVRQLPSAQGGAVPAVALTAYARDEDRAQAIAAGFQTHVAKPVDPGELVRVVSHLISRASSARGPTVPMVTTTTHDGAESITSITDTTESAPIPIADVIQQL